MGAVVATEAVARNIRPGTHGTTFGGNPLACAAGNAVLDVVLAPGFLDGVIERGAALRRDLDALAADFPSIVEDIRGQGLLVGLKLAVPNTDLQAACLAEGLLTVAAGDNVLRLAPPLVVTLEDCAAAVAMIRRAVIALAEPKVAAQ
jgi:acetylornithine/N-succinyldiaminopimelate aminotransferase